MRGADDEQDGDGEPVFPPPHSVTVSDIAGEFCKDFDTWAKEKNLFTIENDWGWFQISATAEDEK